MDTPADVEVGDQLHGAWLAGLDEIIHDPVGNGLVEVTFIPEGPEVELERLQFDAQPVRHIGEREGREVRLTGLWTEAGKLGARHLDLVVAPGFRIGKRFELFRWLRGHGVSFLLYCNNDKAHRQL